MSADNSVTTWIRGLKQGDDDAAAQIWGRFFNRVCGLARHKLGAQVSAVADPEDVALSAMHALYRGARDERFRHLEDRDDLWDVVAMITIRKSIDVQRRNLVRSSGAAEERIPLDVVADPATVDGMLNDGYIETLCETGQELVERLEDRLRPVALLRLEGYSNAEIAPRIGRSLPTVERYLNLIRATWRRDAAQFNRP